MKRMLAALSIALLMPGVAPAITVHTIDFIPDGSRTAFNGFESIPNDGAFFTGAFPYTEDGISVSQPDGQGPGDILVVCAACFGGAYDGAFAWYPNGGDEGYSRIVHSDGSNFGAVGFVTGSGSFNATITVFYELFDNGVSVLAGSVPGFGVTRGYLGFSGGGFDEIRVFDNSGGNLNAFALDSIEETVPEPGTLALLGFGLAAFGMSRRKGT